MRRFLRVAVAVTLTALVIYWSDPSNILAAMAAADSRWIVAAIGLVLVDRTLMALRWIELLVALAPGSRPPLAAVLRVFFESSFISNFIPSVASDLYRAYALSRHDVHLAESTASVLMDRALGVLSVVLVVVVALPFAPALAARDQLLGLVALVSVICAVAAAVVFSEAAAETVRSAAAKLPVPLLHRVTAALTDAVRRYSGHRIALVRVLGMSVAVQLFRVLQAWCLGRALGIELPWLIWLVFIPIIVLVMQVPVTVNGLGTTQLAFERLFVPQGASAPHVVVLSVLFLALGIVGTLPGGVLYALGRDRGWRGR